MLLVDKGSGEKVAMSSAKSPSTTVKMIYSQSRITVSKQNGTAARRIREKYNNKRSVISLPFGVFHVVFSLFVFSFPLLSGPCYGHRRNFRCCWGSENNVKFQQFFAAATHLLPSIVWRSTHKILYLSQPPCVFVPEKLLLTFSHSPSSTSSTIFAPSLSFREISPFFVCFRSSFSLEMFSQHLVIYYGQLELSNYSFPPFAPPPQGLGMKPSASKWRFNSFRSMRSREMEIHAAAAAAFVLAPHVQALSALEKIYFSLLGCVGGEIDFMNNLWEINRVETETCVQFPSYIGFKHSLSQQLTEEQRCLLN